SRSCDATSPRKRSNATTQSSARAEPVIRARLHPAGILGLGALMVLGAFLRMRQIGEMGLWYDEMALWLYSLTGVPTTPLDPPLMAWLLLAAMWLTGSVAPIVVHAVAVAFGVLAIPLAYLCGRALDRDGRTGWVCALLVTLSPMAIYYSREGRPYALF